MKQKHLYILWAVLGAVCIGLGCISQPSQAAKALMVTLAAAFFVPGAVLLYGAIRHRDRKTVCIIRNLAAVSLGLTLAALIGNLLSVRAPTAVGNFLYAVLIIVSTPMVCGQYWVLSLFLWSCLLVASLMWMPRKKG